MRGEWGGGGYDDFYISAFTEMVNTLGTDVFSIRKNLRK